MPLLAPMRKRCAVSVVGNSSKVSNASGFIVAIYCRYNGDGLKYAGEHSAGSRAQVHARLLVQVPERGVAQVLAELDRLSGALPCRAELGAHVREFIEGEYRHLHREAFQLLLDGKVLQLL